jgi:hypothetical protein
MRDLMIHLPATERATILEAWAVAEEREDKTGALRLCQALLVWLRAELTGARPEHTTKKLNHAIKLAKNFTQ